MGTRCVSRKVIQIAELRDLSVIGNFSGKNKWPVSGSLVAIARKHYESFARSKLILKGHGANTESRGSRLEGYEFLVAENVARNEHKETPIAYTKQIQGLTRGGQGDGDGLGKRPT